MIAFAIGAVVFLVILWCAWVFGAIAWGFLSGLHELARGLHARRRRAAPRPQDPRDEIVELYRSEPMISRNGHHKEKEGSS